MRIMYTSKDFLQKSLIQGTKNSINLIMYVFDKRIWTPPVLVGISVSGMICA